MKRTDMYKKGHTEWFSSPPCSAANTVRWFQSPHGRLWLMFWWSRHCWSRRFLTQSGTFFSDSLQFFARFVPPKSSLKSFFLLRDWHFLYSMWSKRDSFWTLIHGFYLYCSLIEIMYVKDFFYVVLLKPWSSSSGESDKLRSHKRWIKMTLNVSIIKSKTEEVAHWRVLWYNGNYMKLFAVSHPEKTLKIHFILCVYIYNCDYRNKNSIKMNRLRYGLMEGLYFQSSCLHKLSVNNSVSRIRSKVIDTPAVSPWAPTSHIFSCRVVTQND